MDPRAYSRYNLIPEPSSSSRRNETKCTLLDKDILGRSQPSDFCLCGKCIMQKTLRESICCREVFNSSSHLSISMKEKMGTHSCVCKLPRVIEIVLHQDELELFRITTNHYKEQLGLPVYKKSPASDPQKHLRHAAYSKLIFHLFGSLGMSNRVELPSCLTEFVRGVYPSKDGTYTGFREAFYDEQ